MFVIGVIRGGPSAEHDVSLKTGQSVLDNLPPKYKGVDIILTREGDWIFNGRFLSPERIFRQIDAVFIALHGRYGEDGKLQQMLELYNIPYTGSRITASALAMNKRLSRKIAEGIGVFLPRGTEFRRDVFSPQEAAREVIRKISPPWLVKPSASGSSFGISMAEDFHGLIKAVKAAFEHSEEVLVEEFIKGREATCGVLEDFRQKEHYPLPVIEIIPPPESGFFDYDAKYSGKTLELCPSNFDSGTRKKIEEAAVKVHQALGCRHYSRSDFIVSQKGIYYLETNTLPGLTPQSLLPKSLEAVGVSYSEFLDHLITLALTR